MPFRDKRSGRGGYPVLTLGMMLVVTRILLAALFIYAGMIHLFNPRFFLPIMPPWIPLPMVCILSSGVCEVLGGIGLLIPEPRVQFITGVGLLLLLVAVFPANIYMAVENVRIHEIPSHPWMAWARLPLQPVIMLGVSWVTYIWPKVG